jgi:S-phase kinase-associated protein 1
MSVNLLVDGKMIAVPVESANRSNMIRSILEDCVDDDFIPVPGVEAEVMESIVEYCTFYVDSHTAEEIKEFDAEFFAESSCSQIFKIVSASNFLDIPDLLESACDAAAGRLRGKSPSELRSILGVTREYTSDEMESVMQENAWAFPSKISYAPNAS